jgi:hypothetical protein
MSAKTTVMMKRRLPFLCFLLIVFAKPHAQVNLQTGSAVFSLPMFNWQDNKSRLNSTVALSYNSGNGLKVTDVASNVGTGWNLVAGGVITRLQVGEPDDQYPYEGSGDHSEKDLTKYPSGILYVPEVTPNGCPVSLKNYPIYQSENQQYVQHNSIAEDKEYDYFAFQFNGKAGMFVLSTHVEFQGMGYFIGDTKMLVTFETEDMTSLGIRTRIKSFTIQDVDGVKYKFSKLGLTKLLRTQFCDPLFSEIRPQPPKFKSDHIYYQATFDVAPAGRPWIVGSWYLEEIIDPLTRVSQSPLVYRKVTIGYTTREDTAYAGDDISYNSSKNYSIVTRKKTITKTPDITSIIYPDGHVVSFNYQSADRFDFRNEKALASVDITYNGRALSRYLLKTSYFIKNRYGTPVTDYQKRIARLCLMSVQKIGVDLKEDSPPYIFDYYIGSNVFDDFVPPAFFYAKDIWGFYNGSSSKGFGNETISLNLIDFAEVSSSGDGNAKLKGLCFLNTGVSNGPVLNAKTGYAKNGLLRQIIYPTGGTLTYEYEQNTGILPQTSTTINIGGVHVSKTNSTDGGHSNGCANPISTQYSYVTATGASSLWGLEKPVNSITTVTHYAPEVKDFHITWSSLPFGECFWHFRYPGILSQYEARNQTNFQQLMVVVSAISGIISTALLIKDIAAVISGSGNPIAVAITLIISEVTTIVSCIGAGERDPTSTNYYNYDLNGVSPLPTQFKRVEVKEGTGGIGKTVQLFTSEDDYPLWAATNPIFSSKQRFAPWAYGLPKLITVYNEAGQKVKEIENFYNYSETTCTGYDPMDFCGGKIKRPLVLESSKCWVVKSISQRNTDWMTPNMTLLTTSNDEYKVDIYDLNTGRTELYSSVEKIYKSGDDTKYAATTTNFYYNDYSNYEPWLVTTTRSNGDIEYKYTRYTMDYSGVLPLTLTINNIVTLPIETATAIKEPNSSTLKWLGERVTEFVELANGDIKPLRILEQRFAQPVTGMTRYVNPGSGSNPSYKTPQTFTYDAVGNLIGMKDEGARQLTNLYGYDDKYAIASVINADAVTDHCSFTSFETGATNSDWTLTGTPAYDPAAVTGAQSFVLSSATSFVGDINNAKPYTLSYWSTNSSVQVSVTSGTATMTKSTPTINGFTYYEFDISQGTTSVTITGGSAKIDELRLYPKNARMNSVTYDPLIGKTSECDANNRITYYEYDNLGRLRFIKDDYRNIVKMYEYNNVSPSKQTGCPTVYYNHAISETFTRNNCGTGYIGASDTVIIAADTYSGSSQADADAQAENYLLTYGQNYANTNFGCLYVYHNVALSGSFTTQNCDIGFIGGEVVYTVAANKYSSTESQARANEMAQEEIDANGQAYANSDAHKNCITNANGNWVTVTASTPYCATVGGNPTPHLFVQQIDINPASSTYNQTRWFDMGPQDACPQTCDFTASSGFTKAYGTPSTTGNNSIMFTLVIYSTNGNATWSNSNEVATITGGCWPTADRTFNYTNTNDGRTWEIIITHDGKVKIRLLSGTAPTGTSTTGLVNVTYQL